MIRGKNLGNKGAVRLHDIYVLAENLTWHPNSVEIRIPNPFPFDKYEIRLITDSGKSLAAGSVQIAQPSHTSSHEKPMRIFNAPIS